MFVGMLFTLPGFLVRRTGQSAKRRVGQAVLRYAAVTLSWIITTQWAFGPPLVDRGFTATGGKCDAGKGSFGTADNVDSPETTKIFSAAQCRMSGGKWKGGRDISGHVFMLALMSAFLFLEWFGAAEVVVGDLKETKEKQRQQVKEENEKKGEGEAKKDVKDLHEVKDGDNEEQAERWMRIIVWVMVGLSFWMLLMTAIFFHTWLEKVRNALKPVPCFLLFSSSISANPDDIDRWLGHCAHHHLHRLLLTTGRPIIAQNRGNPRILGIPASYLPFTRIFLSF